MSAAAAVLPYVWAYASEQSLPEPVRRPEMAFYRKYTEGMLRRYLRMSMEAGKVPSLLGQEMFRGRVTSYRVESFEDVVIFLQDMDRCLGRLDPEQQTLITRLALQQYTVDETAAWMGLNQRTVIRRYSAALDRLTAIFLQARMLTPQKSC